MTTFIELPIFNYHGVIENRLINIDKIIQVRPMDIESSRPGTTLINIEIGDGFADQVNLPYDLLITMIQRLSRG